MATYAVIDKGIVVNKIVCDSKETAEEITRLECVAYTTESFEIGSIYNGKKFLPAE